MLVIGVISWCLLLGRCLGSDATLWGVHPNEIHLYDPGKDFKCKDGSMILDFSKVNDDYCDCADSSDEPSTSACVEGVFYCANKGYFGLTVPSSRVNDGTCDCCDGSDEYASGACVNDCAKLAEVARKEEEERLLSFAEEDAESFRANLVHTGNREQIEKLEKFRKLELAKAEQEEQTKELEEQTRLAEAKANAALDSFRTEESGQSESEQAEDVNKWEEQYAENAFNDIDLDGDGVLDYFEIKAVRIFDLNKNNIVEDREIKWYYDAMPAIANFEVFRKKMWRKMGRLYVLEKEMDKSFQFEFMGASEDEEDKAMREKREKERQEKVRKEMAKIKEERAKIMKEAEGIDEEDINYNENAGKYDDETTMAVLRASEVRREYVEARKKLDDLIKKKDWAEKELHEPEAETKKPEENVSEHLENFGPEERNLYFPGRMHCFKYTDKHHQYKLCPFWGVSQIEKIRRGSGVDLGRWKGWGKEKGEPIMVYKEGALCDNGIRRSTKVRIFCGSRPLIAHVEEPRQCEYVMDFKSPAGCHIKNLKEANVTITSHDEL